MEYELAKELKDAGFPVKEYGYGPDVWKDGFVSPTLSELIEACGSDFDSLKRYLNPNDDKWYWVAFAYQNRNQYEIKPTPMYSCSSPEEAVARLYLQLKKDSVSMGK